MDFIAKLLWLVAALLALPILAYAIVKFGASGYFRAKRRDEQNHKPKERKQ